MYGASKKKKKKKQHDSINGGVEPVTSSFEAEQNRPRATKQIYNSHHSSGCKWNSVCWGTKTDAIEFLRTNNWTERKQRNSVDKSQQQYFGGVKA